VSFIETLVVSLLSSLLCPLARSVVKYNPWLATNCTAAIECEGD